MIPLSISRTTMQPRRHGNTTPTGLSSCVRAFVANGVRVIPGDLRDQDAGDRRRRTGPPRTSRDARDTTALSTAGPSRTCVGRPAELAANLASVDRVSAIVARPVRHECLQVAIARPPFQRRVGSGRPQRLERVADAIDDLHVGPFVAAADIVALARAPLLEHEQNSGAMVVHVQPVADVARRRRKSAAACRRAR